MLIVCVQIYIISKMYKYISLKVAAFVTKSSIILGQLCQNRKEKSNVEKKPSWTFSKGISNCVC